MGELYTDLPLSSLDVSLLISCVIELRLAVKPEQNSRSVSLTPA